jgi:spore germination protein YaaH
LNENNILKFLLIVLIGFTLVYVTIGVIKTRSNSDVIELFEKNSFNLIVDDKLYKDIDEFYQKDGDIWLSIETIEKYINQDIFIDKREKLVIVTTNSELIIFEIGSKVAIINDKKIILQNEVFEMNGEIYCPLKFLSGYYGVNIKFLEANKVIIIDDENLQKTYSKITEKNVKIRRFPSTQEPIVYSTKKGESLDVRIFEDSILGDWVKIRTESGVIGYVKIKDLHSEWEFKNQVIKEDYNEGEFSSENQKKSTKLITTWQMDYYKQVKFEKTKGLDVILPTWYKLKNSEGELIDGAHKDFVDDYHADGVEVFALVANNYGEKEQTSSFLNSSKARHIFLRNVKKSVLNNDIDGINLDFENLYVEDRIVLMQFIKEMVAYFNKDNIKTSVDIPVPDGWDRAYNTDVAMLLGKKVDYVMMMAYDQRWSGSEVAGSISEVSWAEDQIVKALKHIPKEKLLLGIPFYTRLWKEQKNTSNYYVVESSRIYTINETISFLKKKDLEYTWDEKAGQFIGSYKDDEYLYRIWLEDLTSIDLRTSLILKYDIAGVVSWSKSFEPNSVWELINENLKIINDYSIWQKQSLKNKSVTF